MRFWWPIAVLTLAIAMSVGIACVGGGDTEGTIVISPTTPTPTVVPTPTPTPTPAPTPTPTPSPNVCGVNPDPAPPSVLQVLEPEPGERVPVPFHVRGWGSTAGFQQLGVVVAVINDRQDVVEYLVVPPQPRDFRILPPGMENTEFSRPFAVDILLTDLAGPTAFCLWAFVETDEDGNPRGVVQVPVVVAP